MTYEQFENWFILAIDDRPKIGFTFDSIHSFKDCGIETNTNGFVFVMRDGSEFQVSVVKSKLGRDE